MSTEANQGGSLFLPARLSAVRPDPEIFGTFAGEVDQEPVPQIPKFAKSAPFQDLVGSSGGVLSPFFPMPDMMTRTTPGGFGVSGFGTPWSLSVAAARSFRCSFASDPLQNS